MLICMLIYVFLDVEAIPLDSPKRYTPAPYPFTATNELEQALVLAIILTCLPMLGAQIGIISGTLNKMNEKTKEFT